MYLGNPILASTIEQFRMQSMIECRRLTSQVCAQARR